MCYSISSVFLQISISSGSPVYLPWSSESLTTFFHVRFSVILAAVSFTTMFMAFTLSMSVSCV